MSSQNGVCSSQVVKKFEVFVANSVQVAHDGASFVDVQGILE